MVILTTSPFIALADTVQNSQIISLYAQLITLLQKMVALQNSSPSVISIAPDHGVAPLVVFFTIKNPTGTESVIFGDGAYSGKTCTKMPTGWCDLSNPIPHTYQYPGTYTVNVYTHINNVPAVVSTSTVIVTR
jgi:hypothetical protein